jgi:dienelactone hydrolase
MKHAIRLASLLGVILVAPGCCHLRYLPSARNPGAVPQQVVDAIAYSKPGKLICTESNLEVHARFTLHRIETAALANHVRTNRTLALDYYRPVGTNRTPVILVLPIIGGDYPLEKIFCSYFARQGMAAVLVRRDRLKRTIDQLEEVDDILRQAAVDARQAIDWVEQRQELDASRIGVFGISMGGIRAAFLTPLDSRIRAAAIGLAGGDLPYIVTHSTEPGLTRRRRSYTERNGLAKPEFEKALQKVVNCDPLAVASVVDPGKVLLVIAAVDTAVPTSKQLELRRAMGCPETVFLPTGHYTAFLFVPYIKSACLQFFKERFAGDEGRTFPLASGSSSWPASRSRH